jgi:hypothetical protein
MNRALQTTPPLYNYQRDGIQYLQQPIAVRFLGHEQGLGKSVQVLTALPKDSGLLIVCPKSAISVWAQEIAKWRPDLAPSYVGDTYVIGRGDTLRWPRPGEVIVVNYERLILSGGPSWPIVLVWDEAYARLKNPKTLAYKRGELLRDVVIANGGRQWLLSGTPIDKDWNDLEHLLRFNKAFPFQDVREYRILCGGVNVMGTWIYSRDPSPELRRRLDTCMHIKRKKDVQQWLPPITRQEILCPVGGDERREITSIFSSILPDLERARDLRALSQKGNVFHMRKLIARAKIPMLRQVMADLDDVSVPYVVCSAHVDPIVQCFGRRCITGHTSEGDRSDLVAGFQSGDIDSLGVTLRAGKEAINLSRAEALVGVSWEWVPSANAQGVSRVHRNGAVKPITLYDLMIDHEVEHRVREILEMRQRRIDMVLDGGMS